MSKTLALLRAGDDSRCALEEKISLYKENLAYLENKVEEGLVCQNKGVTTIEGLMSEKKQLKGMVKMKSEIIRKQVKLLVVYYLLLFNLFNLFPLFGLFGFFHVLSNKSL